MYGPRTPRPSMLPIHWSVMGSGMGGYMDPSSLSEQVFPLLSRRTMVGTSVLLARYFSTRAREVVNVPERSGDDHETRARLSLDEASLTSTATICPVPLL
jgi:hypothetical protein